jgi:hypothetical protein
MNKVGKGKPPKHTQFKKGQSGNPNGRPKLPDIKEALVKVLADEQEGMTALEAILKVLRQKAIKGDIRAIKELLDRGYGQAKQEIEQTGDVSITINKTYADNSD